MKFILLASLVAASAVCEGNVAKANLQLETQTMKNNDISYNGVKLFVGKGDETSKDSLFFQIDISHPHTLIGDKDATTWGIPCKDEKANSCSAKNAETTEDFYNFFSYKYSEASIFSRFDEEQPFKGEGVDKLAVRLVRGGQKWFLNTYGALGLSPHSAFAKYIRGAYEKDFSLALRFKVQNPSVTNSRLAFDGFVIQNPAVEEKDVLFKTQLDKKADFWTVTGALNLPGTEYDLKDKSFCLTTLSNEIIQTIDAEDFQRRIQEVACSGKYWTDCTKKVADLKKLSPLTVTFGTAAFVFSPEEYTYFDSKDVLMARVGDIGTMRSDRQCPPNTEFGLGKLFFQKYFPLFTFTKDGAAQLSFLSKLEVKDEPQKPWILIAIAVAVVFLAIVIFLCLKPKTAPAADQYALAD